MEAARAQAVWAAAAAAVAAPAAAADPNRGCESSRARCMWAVCCHGRAGRAGSRHVVCGQTRDGCAVEVMQMVHAGWPTVSWESSGGGSHLPVYRVFVCVCGPLPLLPDSGCIAAAHAHNPSWVRVQGAMRTHSFHLCRAHTTRKIEVAAGGGSFARDASTACVIFAHSAFWRLGARSSSRSPATHATDRSGACTDSRHTRRGEVSLVRGGPSLWPLWGWACETFL